MRVPVARPSGCAFGGVGLRRLYVTTEHAAATAHRDDAPWAGRVLELDVGVEGAAPPPADLASLVEPAA